MTRRMLLATLLLAIVILGGCSVAETIAHPTCGGDGGSALITAQSVPSATLLPCFDPLPTGWEVATVDATQAGTTIVIDSDRAGDGAARLQFLERCDVGAAISTPSEHEGAERFELIRQIEPRFMADRYYQFEGGCLWLQFNFEVGAPSAMSVELGNSLRLMDREEVNDNIRETFVDEDL